MSSGGRTTRHTGVRVFELVQGAVLASLVATGPVRRRYGAHPAGDADERFFTLCNLAVKRSIMLPFVDELLCAEENALLTELRRRDVRMHYDPSLLAYHSRRATLRGFASQMYKYGTGRGQLVRRMPQTLRLAHAVPALLVAYLAFLPLLAWWNPLLLLGLPVYGAALIVAAFKVAASFRSKRVAALAAGLTVVVHVCYGLGVARGRAESVAAPKAAGRRRAHVGSARETAGSC